MKYHGSKSRAPGPIAKNRVIGEDNTCIIQTPCGSIGETYYDCSGPVFKPPLVRTPYTMGPLYNPSEFKENT